MRSSSSRARAARAAVSAHFMIMGLIGGVWLARIPAAKSQAHLSDGTLGLALFAVPAGLVLGAGLAERLIDRVGSAVLVRICGVGSCVVTMGPGLAYNLPQLMIALLVIGAFGGTLDVSANAQGVRVEAAYGRPVMTSMHAFFSLGAIIGSLAGAGFAWAGIALLPSLAAGGVAGVLIDAIAARWLLAEPLVPEAPVPEPLVPEAPTGSSVTSPSPSVTATPAVTRRQIHRLVLAIGILGICGLVCEGSAGDWSAVYLRDNLGTSAGFAALAFSAFSFTMTLGRGVGDRLIHRFGVVRVIRVCGVLATIGLALALATRVPAVAIVGFSFFGAGLSIVVPQVFAAGGRADPLRPGSGLARVVGLGYTGMTAGPAVIGVVANRIGLHLALLIPLVLAAWIAIAAPVLRRPANDPSATDRDQVATTHSLWLMTGPITGPAAVGIPLAHG